MSFKLQLFHQMVWNLSSAHCDWFSPCQWMNECKSCIEGFQLSGGMVKSSHYQANRMLTIWSKWKSPFCDACPVPCLKEDAKEDDEIADKDDSSTVSKPAKRARTSFTVDQLQVLLTCVCVCVYSAVVWPLPLDGINCLLHAVIDYEVFCPLVVAIFSTMQLKTGLAHFGRLANSHTDVVRFDKPRRLIPSATSTFAGDANSVC